MPQFWLKLCMKICLYETDVTEIYKCYIIVEYDFRSLPTNRKVKETCLSVSEGD